MQRWMLAFLLSFSVAQAKTQKINLKIKGIFATQKAQILLDLTSNQFTRLRTTASSQMVLNVLGGGDDIRLAPQPQPVLGGKGEVFITHAGGILSLELGQEGKTAVIRVTSQAGNVAFCRPNTFALMTGCGEVLPVKGDLVLKFKKNQGRKGHLIEKIKLGGKKDENWYFFNQLL